MAHGRAAAQGLTYQAAEALCDGQDNDCDGTTDEPSDCCQPSCSSKAGGADDGCGHPCLSGSCPDNATCQSGSCECDGLLRRRLLRVGPGLQQRGLLHTKLRSAGVRARSGMWRLVRPWLKLKYIKLCP